MAKPTFCFLDESGTLNAQNKDVRYFAVGAIVHSYPDDMITSLHNEFEGLCSTLKKDPSRLEYKFTAVTPRSLPSYLKCLNILEQDPNWRFCSFIVDLDDHKYSPPKDYLEAWECYLRYIKMLLRKNLDPQEQTTLIADYLRKPTRAPAHSLATLPAVVPQLWDVLQIESQGVLLVQMADVLLGGSLYQGKDLVKQTLAEAITQIRRSVGSRRFNEWRVKWH